MLDLLFELKQETADPAKVQQTFKDIALFERDVAYCKLQTPPGINRLEGSDRADAADSYRSMWSSMMRTLLDLEQAVSDKKPDEIKRLIAQIEQIENQGHVEFISR
jgi:hypothetical protein